MFVFESVCIKRNGRRGDEKTHVYIKPERIGFDKVCAFLEDTDLFCVF